MPNEMPSPEEIDALLQDFLRQRSEGSAISSDQFLSRQRSTDPRLRALIEEAAGWPDEKVQEHIAKTRAPDGRTATMKPTGGGTQHLEATLPLGLAPEPPREKIDNRYAILKVLGEGGFGKVFLVADTLYSGDKRALKVILPMHGSDPGFEKRFKNEIVVLRALSHPGIPQIFNDGKTPTGEFYYTMAFVPGVTLADVLKRGGPLKPDRIVRIVRQMLQILDYAHQKGVVHRDLKPANIMVVDEGKDTEHVKVLDFGIAKVMRHEGAFEAAEDSQTLPGMGTPHYMSPEQIRGQEIDGRSDMYALGIIIYQMCSGLFPFAGKTAMEIAAARLEQAPKPLEGTNTPEWLKELVMKLLERNKDRRPQTRQIFEQFDKLATGQGELRRSMQWISAGVLVVACGVGWILWKSNAGEANPSNVVQRPANSNEPGVVKSVDKTIQVAQLVNGSHVRNASIVFTGDARGIARIHVVARDANHSSNKEFDVATQTDGSFGQDLDLGPGAWHIEAFDDHERSKPLLARDVVVDLVAPKLSFEELEGQKIGAEGGEALIMRSMFGIKGKLYDEVPGVLSKFTIDGVDVKPMPDGSFRHNLELTKVGVRRLVAHAEDKAGNVTEQDVLLRYAPDKPKIALTSPSGDSYEGRAGETLMIRGRVLGAPCQKLRVDQLDVTERALTSPSEFAYSVALQKGATSFEFRAEDALGRVSDPVRITLTGTSVAMRPNDGTASAATDRVPAGAAHIEGAKVDDKTGLEKTLLHQKSGIRLALVPAGQVRRADAQVGLATPLYVGQYEVTNEEYARFAKSAGREAPVGDAKKPVTNVSFQDALDFCTWAGVRLLTREEWTWCACGGKDQDYPWGNSFEAGDCVARNGDANAALADAGATPKDKSAFDLYDMAGNVQEWCTEGEGGKAALAGGSFASDPKFCRVSAKVSVLTTGKKSSVGFRVALAP